MRGAIGAAGRRGRAAFAAVVVGGLALDPLAERDQGERRWKSCGRGTAGRNEPLLAPRPRRRPGALREADGGGGCRKRVAMIIVAG